jgi:hypothetical protein
MSVVVAGFVGGMGLGAWRYHRLDRRIGAPLAGIFTVEQLGLRGSVLLANLLNVGIGPARFYSSPLIGCWKARFSHFFAYNPMFAVCPSLSRGPDSVF